MELVSEYSPFASLASLPAAGTAERAVEDLFLDFYTERCGGRPPDAQEQALLRFVGEQVRRAAESGEALEQQTEALRKFALEQEETE